MPSITSPPPTTSSPYPSTADTTLASRQPRSDPADPRRTSRRTGRHGPAHGHLAPDRQRADPNPRTERSAAVGMPRQAVVERPDGTTSWAGCTGGPSGLGAPVAPSGLGAPVAPSGCAELGGSGKTGLSASTTAGLGRKGRPCCTTCSCCRWPGPGWSPYYWWPRVCCGGRGGGCVGPPADD